MVKKNEKLRVYIDLKNLNLETIKCEYPMPVVGMLVDRDARH